MTKKKPATKATDDAAIGNLAIAIVDLRSEIDALKNDNAALAARVAELDSPADPEVVNGFDEEFLVGLWLADQRTAGAKTVDLEKVEVIREGIRYALELRTPA